jgi:AmmeMemoRadiSam system protein A
MGAPLSDAQGQLLVRLAVDAVYAKLTGVPHPPAPPSDPALQRPGGSFVTLESRGALRGCVGSLRPVRPLYLDVWRNAEQAMVDPRLPPVTAQDWPTLEVTVSALSDLEQLPVVDLPELLAQLRPGIDGVLIVADGRRSTFLPAVWAKLPEPERFVAGLLAKGGWPADRWPTDAEVWRYTSQEYAAATSTPGRA